jgi:hypothetical protein
MSMISSHNLHSIEINFLKTIKKPDNNLNKTNKTDKQIPILIGIILLLGISVLTWLGYDAHSKTKKLVQDIAVVNTQILDAKAKLSSTENLGDFSELIQLPSKLKGNRPEITEVLTKFAKIVPSDANFASMSLDNSTASDGLIMKVSGVFASTESVISFMQTIKASVEFQLIGFGGMTKIPVDSKTPAPDASAVVTLPLIQATFDIKFAPVAVQKKGGDS